MNLQEVNQSGHSTEALKAARNRHTIRFSQIDGAGIVYYPRYFEMLAESFPEPFAMHQPTSLDLTFHQPARLGEQVVLEVVRHGDTERFSAEGRCSGRLCFEVHKSALQKSESAPKPWLDDQNAFVRQASLGDWMCGADRRLHLSRSYELTAVLMEEWFTKVLLCPFATLESTKGALVPTVRLQTRVHELPQSGDCVNLSLSVLHVGRSSLGMGMSIRRDGHLLIKTQQTVVFVTHQRDQISSVEIPQPVRQRLEQQLYSSSEATA